MTYLNIPGSSGSFPANIRVPNAGDPPTPTVLGQQGVDAADRTAYLKANAGKTVVTRLTSGSGATFTVPAGTVAIRWVVVAGGQGGGNGGVGVGGNGGAAGEQMSGEWIGAAIPSTLTYTVGGGGLAPAGAGGHSWITDPTTGSTVAFAAGAASTPTGAPSDIAFTGSMPVTNAGGTGGTAAAGNRGSTSRNGAGGAGGATNAVGSGGRGYGAGGGGGRQASGSNSGGGGGAGGYGVDSIAAAGSTSNGGVGAGGIIVITCAVTGV